MGKSEAAEIRNTVQRGKDGNLIDRPGRSALRVGKDELVPRLFAPREIVSLEQLLRALREEFGTNDYEWKVERVAAVVARHRSELAELHAFVRGMIYGL